MEYPKHRLSKKMTVGAFLERTIHDMKNPTRLRPTSSYQVYVTLLHRLQEEGEVISMPVSRLSERTMRHLAKWLLRRKGAKGKTNNYLGLMKTFTALVNKAHRARLTRYKADFPYRDLAPKRRRTVKAADILEGGGNVRSLSRVQYEAFVKMDLREVEVHGGPHMEYWKEVYRDFCVMLYELKSRPIDVLQLHEDNIAADPASGRLLCSYIPAKKANMQSVVIVYLSEAAERIVEKYSGKSRGGYIFPFRMNERRWNLASAEQFHSHYKAARNQLWKINKFLHAAGRPMGVPFQLTLYAMRRTAITHAIMENRIPLPALARMAGTSVRMIERHYMNLLHTMAVY